METIKMEAKYIIDMKNNYLVLEGTVNCTNNYVTKMILNNKIPGLLEVELRAVDDRDYIYYNITSKDTLSNIYENRLLDYITLKKLLLDIIEIIEGSNEYLLDENSFILRPDYIYINQSDSKPNLCYYINYSESLLLQFAGLLEYIMNKVDYKDEKAVLLVYALYKITRESNITFRQLKKELNKNINTAGEDKSSRNDLEENLFTDKAKTNPNTDPMLEDYGNNIEKATNLSKQNYILKNGKEKFGNNSYSINKGNQSNASYVKNSYSNSPQYSEEIREEKEVLQYGLECYIITILSILAIVVIFIVMIKLKFLHNSFGTEIDLIKLLCFVIIMGCLEALIINKLFNEDRMRTKIVSNVREVDISHSKVNDLDSKPIIDKSVYKANDYILYNEDSAEDIENNKTQLLWKDIDSEDNKTEILADLSTYMTTYYLQAAKQHNERVYLNTFPLIIGKNTKGVDYTIKEETVSRFHARINIDEEKINITDLGSTNGTYINGTKLNEHTPYDLSINDEISFSKCKFLLKKANL